MSSWRGASLSEGYAFMAWFLENRDSLTNVLTRYNMI
jgi:hypothetical protein